MPKDLHINITKDKNYRLHLFSEPRQRAERRIEQHLSALSVTKLRTKGESALGSSSSSSSQVGLATEFAREAAREALGVPPGVPRGVRRSPKKRCD